MIINRYHAKVKALKKDIKKYMRLEEAGKATKEEVSYVLTRLLQDYEITLDYVSRTTKQEFDRIVPLAIELIDKFKKLQLAQRFIWKYSEFYKDSSEKKHENEIQAIVRYVKNSPDYNRLNFTCEMKKMMRAWKGKTLLAYIENSNDDFSSRVRFLIDDKAFDMENEYVLYTFSEGESGEYTCFGCREVDKNVPLKTYTIEGECKEIKVDEKIRDIYIIKDAENGKFFNGMRYELNFETAIIIQAENHTYAFWRNLIFDRIETAICDTMEKALKKIRSVEEIQEEAQVENPYTITVKRCVEKL